MFDFAGNDFLWSKEGFCWKCVTNEAFDDVWENEDIHTAIACARRYFRGEATQSPVWEILSDAKAVAVADLTEKLQS